MKKLAFLLTLLGSAALAAGLFIMAKNETTGIAAAIDAVLAGLENLGMTPDSAAESIDSLMNLFPQLEANLQELLGAVIPINETTLKAVFFAVPHRLHLAAGGGALMLLGNVLSLKSGR